MKEFEDFRKIVGKLTEEEYQLQLEKRRIRDGQLPHFVKLLKFVRETFEPHVMEAQVHIYGELKDGAFKQLVYRSKEKLLDSWLSTDSITKSFYYDERAKEIIVLRKQLIHFDLLNLRGLNEQSLTLINKIVQKAKLYEYFDVLVFALYKRLRLSANLSTLEEYQRQIKEIEFYEDCRMVFHKMELYHKRFYLHLNTKIENNEKIQKIEKIIAEAETDCIRTNSKTIRYYLLLFKAARYELIDQPEASCNTWHELIKLVSSSKYLKSTHGLGAAYHNLSRTCLILYDFEGSKLAVKRGYQLTKFFDPVASSMYNFLFLGGFYQGDIRIIQTNIEILINFLYSGLIVHYFAATVRYYNACIKFLQEDYTSSYLLLNDVKALERDKESWNIAIRVLSIMNQIELEKFEIADNLIENLRKHHERVRKTLPVTKRDEKIIKILIALSHHSYRFRRTYREKAEAFNLLESLDKEYRWKILSPEMIVFHEWFKAKKDDRKYNHFEVMPAMKNKYSKLHKAFVPLAEDAEIT